MNLSQSRLKFRQRTPWEAADLGRRLIASELGYYMGLYAVLLLPMLFTAVLFFRNNPMAMTVWLWWLKPLAEYGVLSVLSVHAFGPLPPFKQAVKTGFKLMWQKQSIGDLTWRRLRFNRSFHLPIQQLEQLSGTEKAQRQKEIARYGSSTATSLTLFGNLLENIWLYAILIFVYWFLYGNFIEQGLVRPNQMEQLQYLYEQFFNSVNDEKTSDFFQYSVWAYFMVLCFWGPFYVASGFTLYLNARIQTEAWDIRLVWQQLRERLRGATRWHLAWLIGMSLMILPTDATWANNALPDAKTVEQNRQQVLEQEPYYHVAPEKRWCWLSCDKKHDPSSRPFEHNVPDGMQEGAQLVKIFAYGLLIALIVGLIYFLYRQLSGHYQFNQHNGNDTDIPTSLFGLDLRNDTLPKHVSKHAWQLAQTDPRAALSLLYRASLSQLVNQQRLPIKEHHTEGQVLRLVNQQLPQINVFFEPLTEAWLHTAYEHRPYQTQDIQQLCQQYAQHFEMGMPT